MSRVGGSLGRMRMWNGLKAIYRPDPGEAQDFSSLQPRVSHRWAIALGAFILVGGGLAAAIWAGVLTRVRGFADLSKAQIDVDLQGPGMSPSARDDLYRRLAQSARPSACRRDGPYQSAARLRADRGRSASDGRRDGMDPARHRRARVQPHDCPGRLQWRRGRKQGRCRLSAASVRRRAAIPSRRSIPFASGMPVACCPERRRFRGRSWLETGRCFRSSE